MEEFKKILEKEKSIILENLKSTLNGIRTSRPSSGIVENIKVNYYNQILPIKQLGTISIIPPREISIEVWDKNATSLVAKAIESSDLHLPASIIGNTIKVFLPELTQERRDELVKYAKKIVEEFRIKVRQLRDEINKKIQKSFDNGEISEDQKFKLKEETQKEIDKINEEIEKLLENKIREINE